MKDIETTKFYSKKIGSLCKGCTMCVQGKKLVMFVTGLCSRGCYYCPLSEEKKNVDKVWANEREVKSNEDILTEANTMRARGAGFTGGDPLLRMDKTVEYIKLLKKEYGNHFHIHLYTPFNNVTRKNLTELYKAGLDEIRFHPEFDNDKDWTKIEIACDFKWDIGVEIPVIPNKEKEIKKLIDYLEGKIKFLNLNELEISETNAAQLGKQDFIVKDETSYGISGSQELANKLLKYCKDKKFSVHYCTSQLKDKVQLSNRIIRTAKTVKKKFDVVSKSGTLIRGAVYLDKTKPGVGYRRKIKELNDKNKKEIVNELKILMDKVKKEFSVRDDMIEIDSKKLRLITGPRLVKRFKKKHICAIVEEYPTDDQMEVELRFL